MLIERFFCVKLHQSHVNRSFNRLLNFRYFSGSGVVSNDNAVQSRPPAQKSTVGTTDAERRRSREVLIKQILEHVNALKASQEVRNAPVYNTIFFYVVSMVRNAVCFLRTESIGRIRGR